MSDTQAQTSHPSTPDSEAPRVPKLQREAVVMVNERGRVGLLIALCSLAGVAVGFAMSNMAMGLQAQYYNSQAQAPAVQIIMARSADTPTWLGVRITTHPAGGAYVEAVEPGSPASEAGIQRGDVLTGFGPGSCPRQLRVIQRAGDLVRMVRRSEVGERVVVEIERNGTTTRARAELAPMPPHIFYEEHGR